MSASVDVVIAGGGPAGCAAALACARRGLEVLLVDRARFPRDKACGEGLLPTGVAALAELGLLAAARRQARVLDGVAFCFDDDDAPVAAARFPSDLEAPPYGLGVRRFAFDALMLEAVRAQPTATVLEGVAATGVLARAGVVGGLATDVGAVGARAVVAADGLRSRLRQQLGLSRPTHAPAGMERIGLRAHLRVDAPPFGAMVRVLVGRTLEYYVTPLDGDGLQVAILGTREAFAAAGLSATTFHAHLAAHPRLGPLLAGAEVDDGGRVLGGGPFRQRVRGVVTDGALLVGDAAGYVDAITGEGIGAALRQGLVAGTVIADAIAAAGRRARAPLSAAALEPYARAHAAVVRDGDRLTELVLALARRPWLARRAIASLARHPAVMQHLLRVQAGAPLSSVPLRDWALLVTG